MEEQTALAALAVALGAAVLFWLVRLSQKLDQLQAPQGNFSERRQNGAEVSERQEESFWKWFRTSSVACVVVRRQMLIRVNPSAEVMLGRAENELVNQLATVFMTEPSAAYAQEVGFEPPPLLKGNTT